MARILTALAGMALAGAAWAADFDYLVMPLDRDLRVTSAWGYRIPPKRGASTDHRGVDIRGDEGEPVYAAYPGVITEAEARAGHCGMTVVERTRHGYLIQYCHLSLIDVRVGEEVGFSSLIGRVGHTGNVTGPHLHLQLYKDGRWLDPMEFMVPRSRLPRGLRGE
jgi:murein DD-endopeptidase MepM/ murein hydrolase activator NlpD